MLYLQYIIPLIGKYFSGDDVSYRYPVGQTESLVALSRSYCGSWQGAKTGVQPSLHEDFRNAAKSRNSETWA
jgi:hypothetical protein